MNLKKYSVLFRGNAYPIDFYARNKKELRKEILDFCGTDRVPNGTKY